MKVIGLDFTSAPTHSKPITLAICHYNGGILVVRDFRSLPTFAEFEAELDVNGPWIAGIDFPFGQPRKLVENIGWPRTWEGYVRVVEGLGKDGFEAALGHYRSPRMPGDKQHLRAIDVRADSRSPMMLAGVPVGKMFFQGAPRLLKSGCSIVPLRPTGDSRVVIEAYPALVARRWAGRRGYKSDDKSKQNQEKEDARRDIVAWLRSPEFSSIYGFSIALEDDLAEQFILDPSADQLDSLLTAVQAAWAYDRRNKGYGVSPDCDLLEGWIPDPSMA